MMTNRIPYLDTARVLAVYLVIYGHLMTSDVIVPRAYIYAFHMAFFYLVSGMLHKYNGHIQIKKYLNTIGIPIITFNVLMWIIYGMFYYFRIWDVERFSGLSLFDTYKETFISGLYGLYNSGRWGRNFIPAGPTWFLFALFYCKVHTDIIHKNKYIGIL